MLSSCCCCFFLAKQRLNNNSIIIIIMIRLIIQGQRFKYLRTRYLNSRCMDTPGRAVPDLHQLLLLLLFVTCNREREEKKCHEKSYDEIDRSLTQQQLVLVFNSLYNNSNKGEREHNGKKVSFSDRKRRSLDSQDYDPYNCDNWVGVFFA